MKLSPLLLAAAALTIASVASAASIKGVVKYEGEAPKFKAIKMDADPMCLSHHSAEVLPQTLVLGEGQTMANVFVYVKGGLPAGKTYEAPKAEVILDQKGCMYDPHVLGVMVGQPVKILNPDGTLHNVHSLSKINPEFNLAMPKFRTEVVKTFDKSEFMFGLKCDVHPWMGAFVSVMEHPFFATTKTDGMFEIADLESGTYQIEAWHEKLGVKVETVKIESADETKELNFTFSKPQ